MNDDIKSALDLAIERAGGITALARGVGVKSHAVVQQWRLNRVPAEHCPTIEGFTGVRCEDLRPDVQWGVLRGADCAADTASVEQQPQAQKVWGA